MINTIRHKTYATTVAGWKEMIVAELDIDAVSLGSIIADGRNGFGLSEGDLDAFVKECIITLIDAGAVPVLGGGQSPYAWIYQPEYGKTADTISNNLIAHWKSEAVDPDLAGVWFAKPIPGEKFVKMD